MSKLRDFRHNILRAAAACICGMAALVIGLAVGTQDVAAKDKDGDLVIVIDAGHGGDDPGTYSTNATYTEPVFDNNNIMLKEKDLNLQIALAMRDELKQYAGVKVYLTRSGDDWLTNTGRSMVADALHADFLISLHINSATGASNSGALVIRTVNQYYAEASNDMGLLILDNLAALGLNNSGVVSRADDTYNYEDYYTLIGEGVRVGIPSIIVEHLFITNAENAKYVANSDGSLRLDHCALLGQADAQAVVKYFNLSKRMKVADSQTSIVLPKGYSVQVQTPSAMTQNVTWLSLDASVCTVDANGVATAVNPGTTSIVYKLPDGETGSLAITVAKTEPVALVGCLNPTFYSDGDYPSIATNFKDMNLGNTFAMVLYNDGTAKKVVPTVTGKVDYDKIGIQDIEIAYDGLKGSLRVCHKTKEYIPEVTEAPTEIETDPPTQAVTTEPESTTPSNFLNHEVTVKIPVKALILFAIVLLGLIIIGLIILIVEHNRRRRRRNRRTYYR